MSRVDSKEREPIKLEAKMVERDSNLVSSSVKRIKEVRERKKKLDSTLTTNKLMMNLKTIEAE